MKNIIFDTDLGGDCDDVLALDLILSAEREGECRLLAVTYSDHDVSGPACIYAILKQHARADVPVGRYTLPEGKTPDRKACYGKAVVEKFPDPDAPDYDTCPDAVAVLRRTLAENEHVTIIATGFLSNLAALFKSGADEYSPLDGEALVRERVDEIAVMACNFSHQTGANPWECQQNPDGTIRPIPEWNIKCDVPAAVYAAAHTPVPMVFCPFEVGVKMYTGKPMTDHGKGEVPDSYAFIAHGSANGRDSWDPATALYGLYGAKPWFWCSAPGKVEFDAEGVSHFSTLGGGNCRILECALPQKEIAADIDRLVMRLFA